HSRVPDARPAAVRPSLPLLSVVLRVRRRERAPLRPARRQLARARSRVPLSSVESRRLRSAGPEAREPSKLMDKRVLLTVVICMGILFAWQKFFAPPPPPPSTSGPQATTPGAPNPEAAPAPEKPAAEKPAGEKAAAEKPAGEKAAAEKAEAPAAPKPPELIDVVERPGLYRARFSTWGAAPIEWTLLDPQYKETRTVDGKKELVPINLVRTAEPRVPM